MNSYHIFYFPFIWKNSAKAEKLFTEQVDLSAISVKDNSGWQRCPKMKEEEKQDLYNEQNYYYKFVHRILYDNGKPDTLIRHYERMEPQESPSKVTYTIAVKGKDGKDGNKYELKVEAMNLNLYATGVGILTFHLINDDKDKCKCSTPEDILNINQYGRRIFPPFFDDIKKKSETAVYLKIEGLSGNLENCSENFSSYSGDENNKKTDLYQSWRPACFIQNIIADLSSEKLIIEPVIDDRMFVACWYGNNDLSAELGDDAKYEDFLLKSHNHFWYKYVYVDKGGTDPSCMNDDFREELLKKSTYARWQHTKKRDRTWEDDGGEYDYGTLFGISRYSFMILANEEYFSKQFLAKHLRTVYARMVELILVQRASILIFSDRINKLPGNNDRQINALYSDYIRFVNQVYFREVTAQEQGIELYKLLSESLETKEQVNDLDEDISELHQFAALQQDQKRNRNGQLLNYIIAFFMPATFYFDLLGANNGRFSVCNLFTGLFFSIVGIGLLLLFKRK
jgi:hypothetical protein